ncbi:class II aldolase/adducin family protein [Thermoflavimicrobium dichotomicum]|uniref:L-fuculose-phosphate aldolase n=1 Tax=Thermoflavimicrobium dichotomicum TaxID=46223 RepID=A0A1I3T258_9BACL|nr:class II aldolase/adducin family protein [Thermoflavimicrobium dichotomicum]SFJ64760.1 L-fuculose-phosphate aldolase [Thermoflavimicrobium dichotomicum]
MKLEEVIRYARKLVQEGLVTGTTGNVSIRHPEKNTMWITPSAIPYDQMEVADLLEVDLETGKVITGSQRPSSETPMHRWIYLGRSDIQAIVHTHSPYATMFAAVGKAIPAVHYLVADIGNEVPVAPYAIYGSEELARNAMQALENANGALLEHHGVIAVGKTMADAYRRAELIEYVAQIAFGASILGASKCLSSEQLDEVRSKFGNYFATS